MRPSTGHVWRVGNVVDERFARRGHEEVVEEDFLAGTGDQHAADLAEALDARGTQVAHFIAERFVAVERAQHFAGPINDPFRAQALVDADGIDRVALATNHAVVASGNDSGGARQAVGAGDNRLGEVGRQIAGRNARDGLGLERVDPNSRRNADIAPRDRQLPLTVDLVERDDVARVDPVRDS